MAVTLIEVWRRVLKLSLTSNCIESNKRSSSIFLCNHYDEILILHFLPCIWQTKHKPQRVSRTVSWSVASTTQSFEHPSPLLLCPDSRLLLALWYRVLDLRRYLWYSGKCHFHLLGRLLSQFLTALAWSLWLCCSSLHCHKLS